jgi:hypothetical protein
VERVTLQLPASLSRLETTLRAARFSVAEVRYEGLAFGNCFIVFLRGKLRVMVSFDGRDESWGIHFRDERWSHDVWESLRRVRSHIDGGDPPADDPEASQGADWLADHIDDVFSVFQDGRSLPS